jgi:hypothetical protein
MTPDPPVVWIICCADCRQPDLSQWWVSEAEIRQPEHWACGSCGGIHASGASITWKELEDTREKLGGPSAIYAQLRSKGPARGPE